MKPLLIACSLVPLAGCGLMDSDGMKPGKWETTTEIESFEAPGMPAAAVEQMKAAAKGQPVSVCMTKEMVATPSADTFAPQGGGCTSSKFEIKDGQIAAKMSCTAAGGKQDIELAGTIEPESYTLRSTVKSSMPGMGETKMVSKVVSKRVGDC